MSDWQVILTEDDIWEISHMCGEHEYSQDKAKDLIRKLNREAKELSEG